MKFIDEATIAVRAGHGGSGCKSFRREKYVPYGGPDGGDGGDGGDVVLVADLNTLTLLDFKFQPRWEAKDGSPGQGSNKAGKDGDDLIIRLPVGTQVLRSEDGELVCDLDSDQSRFVLAKGGRGGKGNTFFKSATHQFPEHYQPGEVGQEGDYTLSLKLVADVGLIGFPNAGKSTLISVISAARPKIADYPFTTLTPNLGVVRAKRRNFVVADIPGLIPGAHEGKGLGIKFLKHVERTKLLVHLIDPNQYESDGAEIDPIDAYEKINFELAEFSADLATRTQIVVITKIDTITEDGRLDSIQDRFRKRGIECYAISSATGKGVEALVNRLADRLETI